MKKKGLILFFILILSVLGVVGCSAPKDNAPQDKVQNETVPEEKTEKAENTEKTNINFAVLKGPTGIGASKLMSDNENKESLNNYNVTIASAPDELAGKIISGEIDVAAVPTNLAATLYNKTEGKVKIAALNTLGVLYLLENESEDIKSVKDLSGKTIYASGQGATPEYVINYLLGKNGLSDVKVEYMKEHAELATALASGEVSLGVLPEPNVTAVLIKNDKVKIALDLTKEWENAVKGTEYEGSVLTMGCIVVRDDFLNENKEAFDNFLKEYKESINYTNENVEDTAALVEKYEIMASKAAAQKAIPNCNIVYVDGDEMKDSIKNFYEVLFNANPKSLGGKLPDDNFYYKK